MPTSYFGYYVKFHTVLRSLKPHSVINLTFYRLAFEHNQFDIKYIIISKLMNKLTDYYDCLSDFNERIYWRIVFQILLSIQHLVNDLQVAFHDCL